MSRDDHEARLFHAFDCLCSRLRLTQPDFKATLRIGKAAEFPKLRDYAYCQLTAEGPVITVSPKMLWARKGRQQGILRHELAHAVLMSGDQPHSESECDQVAASLFGWPIYYDRVDVQTTDPALAVNATRPSHLPQ